LLESSPIYREIQASQLAEPDESFELQDGIIDIEDLQKELVS
jgi:hypothetical protein